MTLHILYVCDFSSVHSRSYISHLVERHGSEYEVSVISSSPAEDMEGVTLHNVSEAEASRERAPVKKKKIMYEVGVQWRALYKKLWLYRKILRTISLARRIQGIEVGGVDLVHAFRSAPEAVAAARWLSDRPSVPFAVSTWGQDFVFYGRNNWLLRKWIRESIREVDLLFPDNRRDLHIAREEFGLRSDAAAYVMPAPGGVSPEDLLGFLERSERANVEGTPAVLSMRGYETAYNREELLLKGFSQFVEEFPDARLYLDGPSGHPGKDRISRLVEELGLGGRVIMKHLSRPDLMAYMEACDVYASVTDSDGLPVSLLEALVFDCVPVVSAHESVSPPVFDGINGVLISENEEAAIAAAFERSARLVADEARSSFNRDTIQEFYLQRSNMNHATTLYQRVAGTAVGSDSGRDASLHSGGG